jgi:hypothetical protein
VLQPDHGLQHGRRDAQAAEGVGAEVADQRGVGQEKEGFRDERTEGRHREAGDIPIERGAAE